MYRKENFILKKEDKRISGSMYLPEGEGPFPTVILSHGLGENQRDTGAFAENIVPGGIACVTFDFCGGADNSRSSGNMLDMSIYTEKEDLLFVISEVKRLPMINKEQIFLMGMSQGGMISAMAAAAEKENIRGLILLYPGFNIPDLARERNSSKSTIPAENDLAGVTVGRIYYESVYEASTKKEIEGYMGPVLIMHGTADELVPIYYSRRALKIYPNAGLIEFEGYGHNFEGAARKRACEEALAFTAKECF